MKICSIIGVAALLAFAAQPAAAQEAVASKSDVRGAQAVQAIGHCLAKERGDWSRELVTLDYRSDRYKTVRKRLNEAAAGCNEFRRGLRSSGLIFAGSLAEGLLIDENVIDRLPAAVAYDEDRPPITAVNGEDVFGYCVVRKAPQDVARLLSTNYTSDDELLALKALVPVLPTCVPEGQETKFTREAMRALFALSAYRLYRHNLD